MGGAKREHAAEQRFGIEQNSTKIDKLRLAGVLEGYSYRRQIDLNWTGRVR